MPDTLKHFGVRYIFDRERCHIDHVSEGPVHVSHMVHQALVKVTTVDNRTLRRAPLCYRVQCLAAAQLVERTSKVPVLYKSTDVGSNHAPAQDGRKIS